MNKAEIDSTAIEINQAIGFENYNHIHGMGYGLKALGDIGKGQVVLKMKTQMGIASNELFDYDGLLGL